ncbi:MAG: hypothetical protein QOK25_298 [Thermoleophilaceae bacterium]|jgi:hypothetical protein|nr:hypothetical protein [Thermoleophilaceae bacterium]
MYASVRKYRSSDPAEVIRRADEGFIPLVRQVDGFKAYYMADSGDGGLFTITVCDDQAGVEDSVDKARAWVSENAADLIEGAPEVSNGEVRASA